MSSQSILFPTNKSLFITDKSWLLPGKSSKPGQSNFRLSQSTEVEGLSVTIVETGIKSAKKARKEPCKADDIPQSRGLQFVNITQIKRREPDAAELRRIVRSHVMTGTRRRALVKPAKTRETDSEDRSFLALDTENDETFDEELFSQCSTSSWPSSISTDDTFIPSLSLIPSGTCTPLYGRTPFTIHPHFHRLMIYYSTETALTLYPLQRYLGFNPVQRHWFPKALTDEVLLHTIMYSAALGLSRSPSKSTALSATNDLTQLVAPILRLLTSRLSNSKSDSDSHPGGITDATIAAVSCLVMVENQQGNAEKSLLHLSGLAQMIRARGGLENIDAGLVMKIARADSEGSVDNLTRPSLPSLKRLAPPLYDTLPAFARTPPSRTFMALLSLPNLALNTHLTAPLLNLANFTTALNYYTSPGTSPSQSQPASPHPRINPRSYDEDLLSLSASLLSLPSETQCPPQTLASTSTLTPTHPPLETSLQTASLIYTKSINRSLPFSATGSQLLPQRLQPALTLLLASTSSTLLSNTFTSTFSPTLLVWLLTMGGLASQPNSAEEVYFVDQIVALVRSNPDLQTWDGARTMLEEMLFVDVVHELPCQRLWMQVLKMYELKRRWDKQVEMHW